jgi:lysylphosphatidylglycerol synthetase-like protein (DUF2156 family)
LATPAGSLVVIDAHGQWRRRAGPRRRQTIAGSVIGHVAARKAPGGQGDPSTDLLAGVARRRLVRRLCAAGLGVVGVFDLVTAVLPPSNHRLTLLLRFAPIVLAQGAAALLALCGLVLLALTVGLRRGLRRAWVMTCGLLAVAALLHLARGIDGVQAGLSLALLAVLAVRRGDFAASTERSARSPVPLLLAVGLAATVVVTTISVASFLAVDDGGAHALPLHVVLFGVLTRMVGVQTGAFSPRMDRFLSPTLLATGLSLAVLAVLTVTRPLVDRRHATSPHSYREARRVVDRHGGGTLDYFALRYDKRHHFWRETLTTYAVHGGVCLVSPDPIGPVDERAEAWAEFCRFANDRGWVVAVLGADKSWLGAYRKSGMRAMYIGDEAVVALGTFDLAGGDKKGLRQAVNRVARHGYRVSFHDPRHLDPSLADALRSLASESRRGERERGFSMTLGRLFDPDDDGLLLAVAHGSEGTPVAFCQFVPAPSIDGYSLDLMRRDQGDHPNGLIDFVLVSTIRHLRQQGMTSLCLNFATMRAVVAGEGVPTIGRRLLRSASRHLSRSMQIESLWRFTTKYDPVWVGRYLAFESAEDVLAVGLAVARAESFWELPVIGRFLGEDRQRTARRAKRASGPRAA